MSVPYRHDVCELKLRPAEGRALSTLLTERLCTEHLSWDSVLLAAAADQLDDARILAVWLRELITVEWTVNEVKAVQAALDEALEGSQTAADDLHAARKRLCDGLRRTVEDALSSS